MFLVFKGLTRLDALKHLMGLCIIGLKIMTIVGCDNRDGQKTADFQNAFIGDLLFRQTVFHDFKVEIPLTEDILVFAGGFYSGFAITLQEI